MPGKKHDRLVEAVSKSPSAEWIKSYFDAAELLLSETELTSDDPRLVMSLPAKGTLPVTVSNRYVLVAFRKGNSKIESILPADGSGVDNYLKRADRTGRFNSIYDEDESKRPYFVRFGGFSDIVAEKEFRDLWLTAVKKEIERTEQSPYLKHDEAVVYKAVQDPDYRERIIQEALE